MTGSDWSWIVGKCHIHVHIIWWKFASPATSSVAWLSCTFPVLPDVLPFRDHGTFWLCFTVSPDRPEYSSCPCKIKYSFLRVFPIAVRGPPLVLPYTSQPMHSTSCLPIHHHTTTLCYCLHLQHYHWLLPFRSPSLRAYHQAHCLSPVYPLRAWVLLDWS